MHTIRMNLRISTIVILTFFVCVDFSSAQLIQNDNNKRKHDIFSREYLTPLKIIWQSNSSGQYIINSQKLLETGNGQPDLVSDNLCVIKGGDTVNSAIVLDFGKEIHGGIQLVTGMCAGNSPIKVKITVGESVSEAMSKVESSSATNDHAIREYEYSVPSLGSIEIGNSGFRFVKIELLDQKKRA